MKEKSQKYEKESIGQIINEQLKCYYGDDEDNECCKGLDTANGIFYKYCKIVMG